MKVSKGLFLVVGTLLALSFMSCASQPAFVQPESEPGPGESVVVVERQKTMVGMAVQMGVFLDGQKRLSLGSGGVVRIVVPNGDHEIHVGSSSTDKSSSIPFLVNSEEITFYATPKMGLITADFNLVQTRKRPL